VVHFITCTNCKNQVPPTSARLHIASCFRRNWYCEHCDEVVLKTDQQKHIDEFHSFGKCEDCQTLLEKRLIKKHKKEECPKRIVNCLHCQLKLLYVQRFSHEQECGSITDLCSSCKQRIPRRGLAEHQRTCIGKKEFPQGSSLRYGSNFPPQPFSHSSYSSSFPPSPFPHSPSAPFKPHREEDFLCEICQSPFISFDELQVHHLENHPDIDFFSSKSDVVDLLSQDLLKSSEEDSKNKQGQKLEELQKKEKVKSNNIPASPYFTFNSNSTNSISTPNSPLTTNIQDNNTLVQSAELEEEEFENAASDDEKS